MPSKPRTRFREARQKSGDPVVPLSSEIQKIYNTVTGLPSQLAHIPASVEKHLNAYLVPYQYFTELSTALKSALQNPSNSANLADQISTNLTAGLKRVAEHVTALQAVGNQSGLGHYQTRCEYAIDSIWSLCAILKQTLPDDDLRDGLRQIIYGYGPKPVGAPQALLNLATFFVVKAFPPVQVAEALAGQAFSGLWSGLFPYGLGAGDLSAWINQTGIEEEERDFRKELVAAVDHYCRGKFGGGDGSGGLRAMDSRLALEALADFGSVILSTVFGYVVRHPNLPSPILGKMEWAFPFADVIRADDVGNEAAITFSRQLGYQVKAVTGLYLRGFWDVSTMNDSLVESVASLVSNTFSGLLEAFFHDVFWCVEIHEAYPDDSHQPTDVVYFWQTQERVNGNLAQVLRYNVYARPGVLSTTEISTFTQIVTGSETLKNLLQDYGAYMDCLRDYQPDEIRAGVVTDVISALTVAGGNLQAECTFPADFPSTPVLRAYCNGTCVVMDPTGPVGSGREGYICAVPTGATPQSTIYVRSNYGGKATVAAGVVT